MLLVYKTLNELETCVTADPKNGYRFLLKKINTIKSWVFSLKNQHNTRLTPSKKQDIWV